MHALMELPAQYATIKKLGLLGRQFSSSSNISGLDTMRMTPPVQVLPPPEGSYPIFNNPSPGVPPPSAPQATSYYWSEIWIDRPAFIWQQLMLAGLLVHFLTPRIKIIKILYGILEEVADIAGGAYPIQLTSGFPVQYVFLVSKVGCFEPYLTVTPPRDWGAIRAAVAQLWLIVNLKGNGGCD